MGIYLSDVCDVNLGFKSFLNDFFYVDQDTIKKFNIEKEFLIPLFKLGDLNQDAYFQKPRPKRWLFCCSLAPADLKGTGAGQYIEWGSQQETRVRKQTKGAVKWPLAPALQHNKHWYWPAAPLHPTRLAIRKGVGTRYAPFIFAKPQVLDQRLYLLFPKVGVQSEIVQAYIASSFFPLSIETNADMGPGAGVLTLSTDSLRSLPVLDLRALSKSPKKQLIVEAANRLFQTAPVDADGYPDSPLIRELDEALLEASGASSSRAQELERQVAALATGRITKSRLRTTVRTAARAADVERVARVIVDRLYRWLRARRFPEDYFKSESIDVNLPDGPLRIETNRMLGTCEVEVSRGGKVFLSDTFGIGVAELLLRCVQLGRRSFVIPKDESEALNLLKEMDIYLEEFEGQLNSAVAQTGLGYRHEDTVRQIAMAEVNVPLGDLRTPFEMQFWSAR